MTISTYPRNGCTVVITLTEDGFGFEAYAGRCPAKLYDADSGFVTAHEATEAGFVSADAVTEFGLTVTAPNATLAPMQAALPGFGEGGNRPHN